MSTAWWQQHHQKLCGLRNSVSDSVRKPHLFHSKNCRVQEKMTTKGWRICKCQAAIRESSSEEHIGRQRGTEGTPDVQTWCQQRIESPELVLDGSNELLKREFFVSKVQQKILSAKRLQCE
ncbi:hypothetical protein BS47DRAFT_737881 [Hydnum rufescens UP504]|uniref:Uncharacterized protein n=1 Tax=Hydnum rufescens UP504 TaxID=1448309 RepID=A0A9P6B0Z3_9AGAM|nr:hypothetical protein BS47DRAFT_737881 [Hydnum rufescens UP504]